MVKKWNRYVSENLRGPEQKFVKQNCAELNYDDARLTKFYCAKSFTKLLKKYVDGNSRIPLFALHELVKSDTGLVRELVLAVASRAFHAKQPSPE